jgi:hypothetical protein
VSLIRSFATRRACVCVWQLLRVTSLEKSTAQLSAALDTIRDDLACVPEMVLMLAQSDKFKGAAFE